MDSIVYLTSLKGMERRSAEEKAGELLNRTGMLPHKRKRIEELSKGMAQIIQFIIMIIHDPELIILDEPFSVLDPVNTELFKKFIVDLRNQGKAVIVSTNQMNQVEELCDRVVMIDEGHAVLNGNLKEIKSKYRRNSVIIECQKDFLSNNILSGKVPSTTIKVIESPLNIVSTTVR
jgi:ABC-2 type transport system ATP-binding protein